MSEPIQGWWITAKAGDKVVCVDADFEASGGRADARQHPSLYQVLTVKRIIGESETFRFSPTGAPFLMTLELGISCFDDSHFRPLQTKSTETGMSIFKEILERETLPTFEPAKVQA